MGYCSRGLLGFQSDASKLFEQLYSKVNQDGQQAVETLQELWAHAFENMRQGIVDELRFFSRAEAVTMVAKQTSDFRMAVRTLDTNQSSQRSRMAEVISTNGSVFGRLMNSLDFVTHSKHLSLICLIYYQMLDLLELEELRPILY